MRAPRGFALVIVVICSVAMVAIAVALVFTAGSNRLVSVKGSSIDQSETIALAGMERAVAYAERVAEIERDFDKLLDPDESVNCVSSAASQTSPQTMSGVGLPRFSDGAVVNFEGKNYRAVPFNGGAYLIRFDDDVDDLESNLRLSPFTSNRPAGGRCLEGPAFGEGNNPFRDRNRAVWISVVGIYPGTDPARARHRTSLRRFHISTQPLPGVAFFAQHDAEVSDLRFCSALGDVAAGHDLRIAGRVCGTPEAGDNGSVANSDPFTVCTSSPTECAPPGAAVEHVPLPTFAQLLPAMTKSDGKANAGAWFRSGDQANCNLYAREADGLIPGGLYYWDTTHPECVDGPGVDGAGNFKPVPDPPDTLPASIASWFTPDQRGCWVPLFLSTGLDVTVDVLGWPNVVAVGADRGWKPDDAEVSPSLPLLGGVKQPDWRTCQVFWHRKPGASPGSANVGCSACDGSKFAVRFRSNHIIVDASDPAVIPAVSLRYKNSFDIRDDYVGPAAVPADDDVGAWPPLTLLLEDKLETNGSTSLVLGYASGPLSPSLVVNKDLKLDGDAEVHLAGSLVAQQKVELKGNSSLHGFGVVLVGDDFTANGSSEVRIDYDEDVVGAARPVPASPTTSKTIR